MGQILKTPEEESLSFGQAIIAGIGMALGGAVVIVFSRIVIDGYDWLTKKEPTTQEVE